MIVILLIAHISLVLASCQPLIDPLFQLLIQGLTKSLIFSLVTKSHYFKKVSKAIFCNWSMYKLLSKRLFL